MEERKDGNKETMKLEMKRLKEKERKTDEWRRNDGGQANTCYLFISASYANANENVLAPLPWSVEFHQHGLVLRCQVVEVCVPELEHVSARGQRGGKKGQQREGEGGKEAGSGRHYGAKR